MPDTPRRLCLLRHAKSSWDDARLADFDRPLARRGREAAPRIARWMAEAGLRPDHVLCSPALRTRQTWEIVQPSLGPQAEARFCRTIYEAPWERLLTALRGVPAAAHTVLMIGHNPGMEDLANLLAGAESDTQALAVMRRKFPTAALALFDVPDAAWPELGPGCARLGAFVRPKDIDGG